MTYLMQRGWRWGEEVEAKEKRRERARGLRWDREGGPLQRDFLREKEGWGRKETVTQNEKSKRERGVHLGRTERRNRETETTRKTVM